MEELEDEKGLQDYIAILKRNRNKILMIVIGLFVLTVAIALKWPATYKSTATILIEQQEIPQDLVRSTVTSYADQRIQVISQRVMSSVNLKKIIEKFSLYEKEKKTETTTTIMDDMREDINLEMISAEVVDPRSGRPTEATIAFSLSFQHKSPKVTQQVANELVSLYLNENLKRRTEVATEATEFLKLEGEKLKQQIYELETELALFKEKNAASLPELQQLNMQLMNRAEQQIMDLDRQINSLTERKLFLEAELTQIDPNMAIYSATGERIYGSQDRLKSLQAEYISLQARYSATHPDVVKMKKEIEALEKEVGGVDKTEIQVRLKQKRAELATLKDRYSAEHPDVKKLQQQVKNLQAKLAQAPQAKTTLDAKPDNPAYIQLQSQLQAALSDLRSMRVSRQRLMAKVQDYETGLLKAPQVEREYLELVRDYESATLKYREVKSKQMEADMAQAMEKGRKGERFTLIEPPIFPEEPFKPNRIAIVFLGFILSMGMALGFVFVKEALNPAIYGYRAMQMATGAEPLIVIPYIENDADIKKARKLKLQVIISTFAVAIAAIGFFHFFIMPLDVLWYVVLRKMGMSAID